MFTYNFFFHSVISPKKRLYLRVFAYKKKRLKAAFFS